MAQLISHTTLYQVEKDIGILKLYCILCNNHFIRVADESHLCMICNTEVELHCDLTPEQIEQVMVDIEDCCHYFGENDEVYDIEEERNAHYRLKDRLRQYDWWDEDRSQCQFMWYEIRDQPWSYQGYYACARRYFASAYVYAYHRDDYY